MQRFWSLRGERHKERQTERERALTYLFVHFNVKAVGHLVILKHSGASVNIHDHTQTRISAERPAQTTYKDAFLKL